MTLAQCTAQDVSRLMTLFQTIYPANPRWQERAYFDWQFKDSPFNLTDNYTVLIQWDGEEVAGFIAYVPVQVQFDGQTRPGCTVQNWYSLRRDGAALQLLTETIRLSDYSLMMGITAEARQIYQALKMSILPALPHWVGFVNPAAAMHLFKLNTASAQEMVETASTRLLQHDRSVPVSAVTRFRDSAEFSPPPAANAYISRNAAYLNWRYFDIPGHTYQALIDDSGQAVVYRLEQITDQPYQVMRILEWLAWDDWQEVALAQLLGIALAQEVILIDFFCTTTTIGTYLTRQGFMSADVFGDTSIPYLFRPLYYAPPLCLALDYRPYYRPKTVDFSRWYITRGDSDIDRIKL